MDLDVWRDMATASALRRQATARIDELTSRTAQVWSKGAAAAAPHVGVGVDSARLAAHLVVVPTDLVLWLLTTVPIIFPIIVQLGYDPVWFGILITVLMEAALITPPIGVNLYVVQGIRQDGGRFADVAIGAAPFVLMMIVMIALLIAFPELALYLPTLVYRS